MRSRITNSKLHAYIAWGVFIISIAAAIWQSIRGVDAVIVVSELTVSGGITGAVVVANLNKSKTENLSKQRIRYVLMKLLLQDKIKPEDYAEICSEIEHIDGIMNEKLKSALEESVDQDTEVQHYQSY